MRVDLFLESKVSSDHSSHKGFTGSHALSTDQTQIPSGVTSVDVVPSFVEELEPTKYWSWWSLTPQNSGNNLSEAIRDGLGYVLTRTVQAHEPLVRSKDLTLPARESGQWVEITLPHALHIAKEFGLAGVLIWSPDREEIVPVK